MRFAVLYVPDFAAWALQHLDPSLQDADLLVHAAGRVVARSEGLRAVVAPGWAVERAQALAPEARVRPLHAARVALAWEILLEDLHEKTPWMEPCRVPASPLVGDDKVLVTLRFCDERDAVDAAARLRARVGVADDRATALLAAVSAAPVHPQAIAPGQGRAFRDGLPLHFLRPAGIALHTVERLFWLGFRTVGSIARLTPRQTVAQFEDGAALRDLVEGRGEAPVATFLPPPRVVAAHLPEDALREPGEYEPVLQHLLERAVAGLGEWQARIVGVQLLCGDRAYSARRVTHEPTACPRRLGILARLAGAEACPLGGAEMGSRGIDRVTLSLGGLSRPRPEQACLWKERDSVRRAVDAVEIRFPGSALRLVARDPEAYLPEEAYDFERAAVEKKKPAPAPARKKPARPQPTSKPGADAPRLRRQPRRADTGHVRHDGSVARDAVMPALDVWEN